MKILKILMILGLTLALTESCNEEEFLEEEAFDFLSPENSYTTPELIDGAIATLHQNVREMLFENNDFSFIFQYTADYAYDAIAPTHELNSWADQILPENRRVREMWSFHYEIIFNANAILGRIGDIEYVSEAQRNAQIAEAKYFRAWAYRGLGIVFGGVPITLNEVQEPKRDYVRASRTEVWNRVIKDLQEAVIDLPNVGEVEDGRITKGVAYHLLAEMYIITGDYNEAIAAATEVIDNLGYSLMTERFGTRVDEPGDVYWDLFRRGNQNRSTGNTESIWVSQYEYLTPGGGGGDNLPRFLMPLYWQLKDDDGVDLFTGPNDNFGGRGIGWWAPSQYWLDLWEGSNDDMRNSEYNIIRDIRANNPTSRFFGELIVESGAIDNFRDPFNRWWNLIVAKGAPIGNFPDEFIEDPETGLTTNAANSTHRDRYLVRLPDTYLLRAEAHLLNGDQTSAAADINVVRNRVNADPVSAAEVDMDYILDERARELFNEELRLLTLMRMDKIVERVRMFDPMHNGQFASNGINDHQNLWPIPNTEIERNTEAVLEQNPGY